jgi:putative ABC transport system ATP-binding protein
MAKETQRPAVVRMEGVYKYHYTEEVETAAVNGVDLQIEAGEFVAIMGPSGSGKSTLLNLVGMVDDLSKGQYWFNGHEVSGMSRREKAKLRKGNMGFVFQSFNLIDELTAYENIELPLIYLKVPAKERRERVERALASLEMTHRRSHYPQQLSGGQQQRVAIARAIVPEPALILADEPTGNLDSENSQAVMQKLSEFHQQGATIVAVTHSEEDASYAQRRIELFDGKTLLSEEAYLTRTKK